MQIDLAKAQRYLKLLLTRTRTETEVIRDEIAAGIRAATAPQDSRPSRAATNTQRRKSLLEGDDDDAA